MSWFDSVTGSSAYERQSWRDSYNDGRAAGDITGNINRQLDAERAAFQGATWSGSSSQPSALELARAYGVTGAGVGWVANGDASSSTGPGNGSVSAGPDDVQVAGPGGGRTGGSLLQFGTPPLTPKVKTNATGGFAGVSLEANPWFSDVQDYWEPRAGEPGEWLGGIITIGADIVWNTGRAAEAFDNANERMVDWMYTTKSSLPRVDSPMAPMGAPASLNW